MALRLNKIPDELILEDLPRMTRGIETLKANLSQTPAQDRKKAIYFHELLAEEHFEMGCVLYQQERPLSECRDHLHKAGEHSFNRFRMLEVTETELRQFPIFERLLSLLICFGTPEMRQKAGTIPQEIYHYRPVNYKSASPPFFGVIEYLELLKKVAAGMTWDEPAYLSAKARCLDDNATKLERVLTIPKLESVRAAVHGDGQTWNENIAEIVKQHKHEATRGEWREDVKAFICLPGLAMAQLGIERGLVCSVNSPYLPLQLLRGDA